MKWKPIFSAAVVAFWAATAFADTFSDFIVNAPSATQPFVPTAKIPVVEGEAGSAKTHSLPASDLLSPAMLPSASNATLPEARTNLGVYQFDPVKDRGAPTNGTSDATAAITASLADCGAAGGGRVVLGPYRFNIATASLTIPPGCRLGGEYTPKSKLSVAWSAEPSAVLLNPAFTMNVDEGATLENVLVLNRNLPATPTTLQQAIAMVAGFAGTAVTLTGRGATLRDVQILGFASPVVSDGWHQLRLERVFTDGTNGVYIKNSHDISVLEQVEAWPFLTASTAPLISVSSNISGAADNGAGKVRLTVASTVGFLTGNTLFASGIVGFTGGNTKFTATVVNATTLDTDIDTIPSGTGAVESGRFFVKMATPNKGIAQGQTITAASGFIPGATTVTFVSPEGYVWLSAAATGTNAADTLTFTNAAYSSAGIVYLNSLYRSGTGLTLESNVGTVCFMCFMYGYEIGADLVDESAARLHGSAVDSPSELQNTTSVGIRVRGASRSNYWYGGSSHGSGTALLHNSTNPTPNYFLLPRINQSPLATSTIALLDGSVNISNSFIFQAHTPTAAVFVADTMDGVIFSGNDFAAATGYWSAAGAAVIHATGTPWSSVRASPRFAPSQMLFGTSNTTIAAGATAFFVTVQGTEAVVRVPVPGAGRLRNLYVENSVAPGGVETQIITLRSGGADTIVTCTITGAARTCNTLGTLLEQQVPRGAVIAFKVVTSAAAALTTIKLGLEFVPSQ